MLGAGRLEPGAGLATIHLGTPPTIHGVFSVSPAEILTIALIALIVFGPKRLPEISRKAGKVLRELKETAGELKAGIEAEYDGPIAALGDVRREMRSTLDAVAGGGEEDPGAASAEPPPSGE